MSETENTPPAPLTKAEIISAIAKTLADRRKARNLSLDKVFQNIRIRIPYLESIEKGEWGQLPGEVYIRGFIKRYADHLGLDGEKLLAPYFEFDKKPEKKSLEYPPLLKGAELTRGQLIGASLVAILVLIFIKLLNNETKTPPVIDSVQTKSVVQISTSSAVVVNPAAEIKNTTHQLDVFSPLPLWLRVTSRDKAFEGFIPQGATWTWKGEGTFSIRWGHTQQLLVHFDGQPVAIQENMKKIELPSEN